MGDIRDSSKNSRPKGLTTQPKHSTMKLNWTAGAGPRSRVSRIEQTMTFENIWKRPGKTCESSSPTRPLGSEKSSQSSQTTKTSEKSFKNRHKESTTKYPKTNPKK